MGDDGAVRRPPVLTSLRGYQRSWAGADAVAGLTLLVIAVPEQLATSRLAGMPPVTGFYAFVAGTVLFALLGSNPQLSVGADSTIAPLFAAGVASLAASGSERYVDLVSILAVMVGLIVFLVSILRLGWIADFLSAPIVTGFLSGVAVIIVIHQLPELLGMPDTSGSDEHRIGYVLTHLGQVNGWALGIGISVLAFMTVCKRVDRRIPAALFALVGSTALVGALDLTARGVAVLGPVASSAPQIGLTGLSWSTLGSLAPLAGVVALVVVTQTAATTRAFAQTAAAMTSTQAATSWRSAPEVLWPGWWARSRSTPARPGPAPWPPRAAAPRPARSAPPCSWSCSSLSPACCAMCRWRRSPPS